MIEYTRDNYERDCKIRDGALNYCSHVDKNAVYGWYDDACACWEVSNTSTGIDIESIRSLSDINQLIAFYEREQELRRIFNLYADSGDEELLSELMRLLPPLPQPPQERDDA